MIQVERVYPTVDSYKVTQFEQNILHAVEIVLVQKYYKTMAPALPLGRGWVKMNDLD